MILGGITSGIPGYLAEVSDVFELVTSATGDGISNDLPALISDVTIVSEAGGGTLKLRRGTYLLDDFGGGGVLIAIPSNVRVLGAGRGVTIVKSVSVTSGASPFGFASGVTNATVEAMTIDSATAVAGGNGVNFITATYCRVVNVRITANFDWGCFIGVDSSNCEVISSIFDGTQGAHGVEINGSSYNTVNDCTFLGASGQNDIEIYDASATRVVGNLIANNTFLSATYSCIVTAGDFDTVISNNIIKASQRFGIYLGVSAYDAARFPTNVVIDGNTILGCNASNAGSTGINASESTNVVVSNNAVRTTAFNGIGLFMNQGTGGSIVGNVFSDNGGNGATLNDNVTRCAVVGNQFINNSGAAVDASMGLACTGTFNSFIGNTGNDTRGASNRQYIGINITGASNTVIGNRGTGNRSAGVAVTGATCWQLGNDQTNTPTQLHGYLGFNGATPVAQSTGWAVSNVSSDKVFDANATSIDELADVLGTLITYLISRGDIAA